MHPCIPTYLIQDTKSIATHIRLAHIEQGLPDPTENATLHLVCRGIRCQQDDNQRTRLLINTNLLRTLKEQLQLSQLLYHFGAAYTVDSIHCCILHIFQS